MLGAIAGDIIGSVYEFHPWQGNRNDFPLFSKKSGFTDDTVLTIALAQALIGDYKNDEQLKDNIINNFHLYGRKYPDSGFGGRFNNWLRRESKESYNSLGNGSAMRVSPVGWFYNSLEDTEKYAKISAEVTHNHPEGIKGACSVAGSIFLARKGKTKEKIKNYVSGKYGYDLSRTLIEIKKDYHFDETCPGSVPESITAFLESDNFEEAIRNAVWLGGDADTQAAIAGSIAEAFYDGVPPAIKNESLARLDDFLLAKYDEWTQWMQNK